MQLNTKKRFIYGTILGSVVFSIIYYFIHIQKNTDILTTLLISLGIDQRLLETNLLVYPSMWLAIVAITILLLPYIIFASPYVGRFIVKAFKLQIKILKLNKLHKLHNQGVISRKDYLETLAEIKKS